MNSTPGTNNTRTSGDESIRSDLKVSSTSPNKRGNMSSLLAGAAAGAVNTVVCCPLDVAKVRMQVQGTMGMHKYLGIVSSLRTIYVEEGMRGMFRGLGPALMTVPLFWGIYFYAYDYMKMRLSEYEVTSSYTSFITEEISIPVNDPSVQNYEQHSQTLERKERRLSPMLIHVAAAVSAGAIGDVISNPLWVLRTRIQTLALHSASDITYNDRNITISEKGKICSSSSAAFSPLAPTAGVGSIRSMGMWQMARLIYQHEGIRAFYKGLNASFLGLSHVAVQFPLYEKFKLIARNRRGDNNESAVDLVVSSITSKYIATLITYPHEVLRARMQDQRYTQLSNAHQLHLAPSQQQSPTLRFIVRHMIETEGVGSLWAGLRVNLVRVIPSTLSTFLCYEYMSRYLQQKL